MKDIQYYIKNRSRYEEAVPKLRKMISELECYLELNELGQRKLTSLIHELGRIQGILSVLPKYEAFSICGLEFFACYTKQHCYQCAQPFDFCPSCGDKL